MKQKVISLVCVLVLCLGLTSTALALPNEQQDAADVLKTLGLVQGTKDGYDLQRAPTRAEAVSLIVRLAGAEKAAANDNWISGFRDVPQWAETAVNYAAHQNWVTGIDPYTLGSNQPVSANAF